MPEIKAYGIRMNEFNLEDIQSCCYHSQGCPVELKNEFNKGDTLIGVVHSNKDYLIYSCGGCGGLYIMEGKVPKKVEKGL